MRERFVFRIAEMIFARNPLIQDFLLKAVSAGNRVKKISGKKGIAYKTLEDSRGRISSIVLDKKGTLLKRITQITNNNNERLIYIEQPGAKAETILLKTPKNITEISINGGGGKTILPNGTIFDMVSCIGVDMMPHYCLDTQSAVIRSKPFYTKDNLKITRIHNPSLKTGVKI